MDSDRELSNAAGDSNTRNAQSVCELEEEKRKIRRFQIMMDMVQAVIAQSPTLTIDEAAEMVAETERVALDMFPEKEQAYRMIYKPRLQRVMRERYRIQ